MFATLTHLKLLGKAAKRKTHKRKDDTGGDGLQNEVEVCCKKR